MSLQGPGHFLRYGAPCGDFSLFGYINSEKIDSMKNKIEVYKERIK